MNMKRKSPISVGRIQFHTYDPTDESVSIDRLPFNNRGDFALCSPQGGIAVKITFNNDRYDTGVRRDVALTLVDATTRCEVATRTVRLSMCRREFTKNVYADFHAEEIEPGHTYRLVVSDTGASQTLAGKVIHVLDMDRLPHPAEWYGTCDGGLRPAWESNLYKSLNTTNGHDYYVRFNLEYKLGYLLPAIMPELELRLYLPEGREVEVMFREPRCLSEDDYKDNRWFVEYPFTTSYHSNGVYYAELLCMECPIAGFVFDTNGGDERGGWYGQHLEPLEEYSPEAAASRLTAPTVCAEECPLPEPDEFDRMLDSFLAEEKSKCEAEHDENSTETDDDSQDESITESLDHLTGLRSVKEKLTVYERVVRFNRMRSDAGLPTTSTPLHAMFLGSPGTGKTTVAKMMGAMLHRAGVLSKGHVVIRERSTLLGQNYNSESEKTLAAIEEAGGGILFIDEAYQLYQPNDSRDPGKFVIETLLTALADESDRDWMLVLAGYPDEMRKMFEMNPGFKSRIPESNIYLFEDFTESELIEIAEKYLSGHRYNLSDEARIALGDRLRKDYTARSKNFGNARHVINMIQTEIIPSMAVRVTNALKSDENSLSEIKPADIPLFIEPQSNISRPRVGFV